MKPHDIHVLSDASEGFLVFIALPAQEAPRGDAHHQPPGVSSAVVGAEPDAFLPCTTELTGRLLEAFEAWRARGGRTVTQHTATAHRLRALTRGSAALLPHKSRTGTQLPELWLKQLTRRELQVVTCVVEGLPNQGIADELGITTATVKRHVSNSFDKLGCDSRAQLIAKARSQEEPEIGDSNDWSFVIMVAPP